MLVLRGLPFGIRKNGSSGRGPPYHLLERANRMDRLLPRESAGAEGCAMSGQHAFLAPSSAHRWVFCPGSARLEALYPQTEETPEAAEGTAWHWVTFDCMMIAGRVPAVGEVAPNGVHVDETMIEAAHLTVADVVSTLGPRWREMIVVEQRVSIPRVSPHNWGTPDLRAWRQLGDGRWMLHVWDGKYGFKIVEAFENWQCIDYACGLLTEAKMDDGLSDQNTLVDICVIQPRAPHREGPVRRWTVKASDLRAHINRLHSSATEATGDNPKCYPEPSACENCNGRHKCEAIQRSAFRGAEMGHAAQPLDLTPAALGLELRTLTRAQALMKARISGLEEHAVSLIKRGSAVPWWMMESTPGRQT
jgi:Protein of unknown function (DUF2800)